MTRNGVTLKHKVSLFIIFASVIFHAPILRGQNSSGMKLIKRDTLTETLFTIEHKPLRAGVDLLYGLGSYYDANLPAGAQQIGCDHYSAGSGSDYGIRLFGDMPLWGDNSPWTFQPNLDLIFHHANFSWLDPQFSYVSQTDPSQPFTVQHTIDNTIGEAGMGAGFGYEFADRWYARAAADINAIFEQSYVKSLHVVEDGNSFRSGSRDSVFGSGNLPGKIAFVPSLSGGLSYELPLSKKLRAAPGLEVSVPFGGQTGDGSEQWRLGGMSFWRGVEVNASLALFFDLTLRKEQVPVYVKSEIIDTVRELPISPAPKLSAAIRAFAVSASGDTSPVVNMTVEEIRTRNADPVLNYIFFDSGSASFPSRYVTYPTAESALRDFKGSSERHDIKLMDLYLETLNILGDRMRKYPQINIAIKGSTDNAEDRIASGGNDKGTLSLAKKRAEAVRDYLVNIWQIDPARMKIEFSLLPDRPSPLNTMQGQAENRRVEFRVLGATTDERLTGPITVMNIEEHATPDRIVFRPSVETQHGILRTYAWVSAGGVELQSFKGDAENSTMEKIWAPSEETLNKLSNSLDVDYNVEDSAGNHAHAHSSIPLDVIRVTGDRPERVERFSLILFSFDESRLDPSNESAIRKAAEMIRTIPVKSILIQGYTDETGDAIHNDGLSEARANAVRDRLEEILRDKGQDNALTGDVVHSEGRGSRDLLYDNRLPEGRFFSRTVNITIERGTGNNK